MFRYLRYLFLAALAIVLLIISLANRDMVTLKLLPEGLAHFARFNMVVQLPLFLAIFGGIVLGLLIGFVWEWLREARLRSEGDKAKREAAALGREVKRLKAKPEHETDDVIALLENSTKAG